MDLGSYAVDIGNRERIPHEGHHPRLRAVTKLLCDGFIPRASCSHAAHTLPRPPLQLNFSRRRRRLAARPQHSRVLTINACA